MAINETVSLAVSYKIEDGIYECVPIEEACFSNRTYNALRRHKISTLKMLILMTPEQLSKLNGLGKKGIQEIESYVESLSTGSLVISKPAVEEENVELSNLELYAQFMLEGDFSFAENSEITDGERKAIARWQKIYDTLGKEMVDQCRYQPEQIKTIIEMLTGYTSQVRRYSQIVELMNRIPRERLSKKVIGFIYAFTRSEEERKKLLSLYKDENCVLSEIDNTEQLKEQSLFGFVKSFLEWCTFDLSKEMEGLATELFKDERACKVIEMRARGYTLEEIGRGMGVTRERIRQIEGAVRKTFSRRQKKLRTIAKVSADNNSETMLASGVVEQYMVSHSEGLLYLFKYFDEGNYTYAKQFDAFVLGDDSTEGRISAFIELLPEIFNIKQIPEFLEQAQDEGLPMGIVEVAIKEAFRLTGDVYHRCRLSLTTIYSGILEKYYSQGLKIYDSQEIDRFRQLVYENYGDVKLPVNDRALAARITDICVMCDKGTYKLKQEEYIPKWLAKAIYDYVLTSESTIFLTNIIYKAFERDLQAAGVMNKYYLQGILHQMYGDKFIFRRDYISKDANFTSIYSTIIEYIKKFSHPISKQDIQNAFPGITEIVVNFAVDDPNILNYFGEYLHASHLKISAEEKAYLKAVVDDVVGDYATHHIREIYDRIVRDKPEIFSRNGALYPFSGYSILEYLFEEEYQFSRPYIGAYGIELDRAGERLHDLIYASEEFEVADIREFAKENYLQVQSVIEYVDECNDRFLFVSANKMASIERIGVTEEIARAVEEVIFREIVSTQPIYQLNCWDELPPLAYPWTDWLVYSILKKWATKLSVGTSSNQMRIAIPLVAPTGGMDASSYNDAVREDDDYVSAVDDLEDIDLLLEDIIGDDIWESEL